MYTAKDLALLTRLQYQHPLLPVGADRKGMRKKKKAPVNKNGLLLSGWTRHEGFTTKELWNHPHAISIGIRCDNLFVNDIDGETTCAVGVTSGEFTTIRCRDGITPVTDATRRWSK